MYKTKIKTGLWKQTIRTIRGERRKVWIKREYNYPIKNKKTGLLTVKYKIRMVNPRRNLNDIM